MGDRLSSLVARDDPLEKNASEAGEKGAETEKLASELAHLLHQLVILAQQTGNQVGTVGSPVPAYYAEWRKAGHEL